MEEARQHPVVSVGSGRMLRLGVALGVLASSGVVLRAASADPVPVIATYELHKAAEDRHDARRDPKRFWLEQIVTRIESKVARSPLRLKSSVVVQLGFTVARDGRLVSQAVTKSSGIAAADNAATRILATAAPFPPMPPKMTETELAFTLPIRFR